MNINTEKRNLFIGRMLAFVMAIALLLVFDIVRAEWVWPSDTPPNAGVDLPISASSTAQVKTGALSVHNLTAGTVLVGSTTPAQAGRVFVGVDPLTSIPNNSIAVAGTVRAKRFCLGISSGDGGCIGAWTGVFGTQQRPIYYIVKGSTAGLGTAKVYADEGDARIGAAGSSRVVYASALEATGVLNAATIKASTTIPTTNMILTVDTATGDVVLKKCGPRDPFLTW